MAALLEYFSISGTVVQLEWFVESVCLIRVYLN